MEKKSYNYYVNGKKVCYNIFNHYLIKATKAALIYDNELHLDLFEMNKFAEELYWECYYNMRDNGMIYTINKVEFEIRRK